MATKMKVRLDRLYHFLFLTIGVVVTNFYWENYVVYGRIMGFQSDSKDNISTELLRPSITFNDIEEIRSDNNGDGEFDRWIVAIRRRDDPRKFSGIYYLRDTNFDSIPDMNGIILLNNLVRYNQYDDNNDGKIDYQSFGISDFDEMNPIVVIYYDLDLNTTIDMSYTRKFNDGVETRSISLWFPKEKVVFQVDDYTDWQDGYTVPGSDGIDTKYEFDVDEGVWVTETGETRDSHL
jgi:hypothetical protein